MATVKIQVLVAASYASRTNTPSRLTDLVLELLEELRREIEEAPVHAVVYVVVVMTDQMRRR